MDAVDRAAGTVRRRQKGGDMKTAKQTVLRSLIVAACVLAAGTTLAGRGGGRGHGGGSRGHGYAPHRGGPGIGLLFGLGLALPPPPFVMLPAPVVIAPRPVVVQSGYWQEREERVWIEGCWVETFDPYGRRCKSWQPGRWEIRRIREWVE